MKTPPAFAIGLKLPIGPAIEALRSALVAEQMGIVSEVDVQVTRKHQRQLDSHPQWLLGISGPLAAQAMLCAMASDNTAARTACGLTKAALRQAMSRRGAHR